MMVGHAFQSCNTDPTNVENQLTGRSFFVSTRIAERSGSLLLLNYHFRTSNQHSWCGSQQVLVCIHNGFSLFQHCVKRPRPVHWTRNYTTVPEAWNSFSVLDPRSDCPPSPAMFTAATWFHRFYMRYSMDEFHRQDVAAACIFLTTKTEECGRKLRDVARVCRAKITGVDISQIPPESKEVESCLANILLTEEVLLEALCFDFAVDSPHAELVDLFDSRESDILMQEYAWSLAHDSYRTPMCILYSPRVIATACYVLAQRIYDGPNSTPLDSRIAVAAPSSSLPTPPSHKPPSPDASRYAIEHLTLNENELTHVSEALCIFLEFYSAQDVRSAHPYLAAIVSVHPPVSTNRPGLYIAVSTDRRGNDASSLALSGDTSGRTPCSSHGGHTPATTAQDGRLLQEEGQRLDLG